MGDTNLLDIPDKVPASNPYFNLGDHHCQISTSSPDAQTWFDRGLAWLYAFNHGEAITCFKQVLAHDPACAMGYWAWSYAAGPNYNRTWKLFALHELQQSVSLTYATAQKAAQVAAAAMSITAKEKALIDAVQHRYPSDQVPEDIDGLMVAYADAMRTVYKEHAGTDMDMIALCAEALMVTAPWRLYHSRSGEPDTTTPVLEVKAMLESAMQHPAAKRHPGVLHLYIHLTEMSRTPEMAVLAADHLRDLVPDGAHVTHMPSHIDVLVGDYRRALHTNIKAIVADHKYLKLNPATDYFYNLYVVHDYHSGIYAAMLAGNKAAALELAEGMDSIITDELLRVKSPDMATWLEGAKGVRTHVLIRFGMWDELKGQALPTDRELYCVTLAVVHYGRAIAHSATGEIAEAEEQRTLFLEAAAKVPKTRLDFPVVIVDELEVAKAMLDGELEYRRGNHDAAFEHLRRAVELDDGLAYSEPWGWMLPTRHPYAALLLEQGRVEDALGVYAEDLGFAGSLVRAHQHPNNIWALKGYHECLTRLGRGTEAAVVRKQLTIAEAGADIEVRASCFCRRDGCCGEGLSVEEEV